jgi:hypothetical protein
MNRNAFAAVLLSGWLLMFPRLDEELKTILLDVPILDWEQVGAYDSAKACEGARERGIDLTAKDRDRIPSELWDKTGVLLFWRQAMQSRCVPADYIYPPRK